MKTTIWLSILAFFIIYSSKPTVSFKPFSIEFENPYSAFAIIFLSISMIFFQLQARKDVNRELFNKYYTEGYKDGSNKTIEKINEKLKNENYSISIDVDVK